jgi:hypothetical protein
VHERTLDVGGGDATVIDLVDRVHASELHDYDVYWHVGPGLEVALRPDGFDLVCAGRRRLALTFTSATPVQQALHVGEAPPRVAGWRFPRFGEAVPSPVVRQRLRGQDVELSTTIHVLDEPLHVGAAESAADPAAVVESTPAPTEDEVTIETELTEDSTGAALRVRVWAAGAAQYAFKLYRGSTLVEEVGYSRSDEATWTGLTPGRYRVRGYARTGHGHPAAARTTDSLYVR